MPKGICRLCLEERELRNSHFMPKALYRDLQMLDLAYGKEKLGVAAKPKNGLVVVGAARNSKYLTSLQLKQYLLCDDCEQLFSTREDFASTLWKSHRGFGALYRINSVPQGELERAGIYPYNVFTDDEKDMLVYFMASIVWRADCKGWRPSLDKTLSTLGTNRREEFRRYLLGQGGLTDYILILRVDTSDDTELAMSPPQITSRYFGSYYHHISVPGLTIELVIGAEVRRQIPIPPSHKYVMVVSVDNTKSPQFLSRRRASSRVVKRYKD